MAVREVPWLGGTVRVHACRNEECGNVYLTPISIGALAASRVSEIGGFSPVEVNGGLSDLLDQVRQ